MTHIVDYYAEPGHDYRELNRKFESYRAYLASIEDTLPPSTFAFATAPWHYDVRYRRCLHDSWVESVTISEVHPQNNQRPRHVRIQVRLLGPYHDGYTELEYVNVMSYDLNWPGRELRLVEESHAHYDWLVDEVRLSAGGHIVHEIVFSSGGRWVIICSDILCEWADVGGSGEFATL